jgi:hypothetical protein
LADLEAAAADALITLKATLAATDELTARFLEVRERVARMDETLDAGWARLRERAQALLVQTEEESRELMTARGEALAALDDLGGGLADLRESAPRELDESRREVETFSVRMDALPLRVQELAEEAQEADRRLEAKLDAFEQEVEEALARSESLLTSELAAEIRRVDSEIERVTTQMQDYVEDSVLPVLADRAQDLTDQLGHTEDELNAAMEAAGEEVEATTDNVLRACNEAYDETLADLIELARELEKRFEGLRGSREDKHDEMQDSRGRWQEAFRASERALKEANDTLKELEDLLSRYSFVRL